MNYYELLDNLMLSIVNILWSTPLIILLLGGGIFFTVFSKLKPYFYLKHALDILMGRYDSDDDPGQITHFEALSSALSSTVGMGNIAGVAVALHMGGPGAIFWMWLTALFGMSTKFFTCSLAILFRGKDDSNEIQGGVMYYIDEGLGKHFKPLSIMFSLAGLFGCITFFQANQLSQIIRDNIYVRNNFFIDNQFFGDLLTGVLIATIVSLVIFGGIKRIAKVASRLVPFMVGLYLVASLIIIFKNIAIIPSIFINIFTDAFSAESVKGGALGSMILIGVKRGLFSNEAGTGTEAMAHGAAKTSEAIREGLVAMLGPLIDTILVCTITALVLLVSDVHNLDLNGVSMTAKAFNQELGIFGDIFLFIAVVTFSLSTMFGYSYYGRKCCSHLFGTKSKIFYNYFYIIMIVVASVSSIDIVINFVDSMFALMVIPTMISTLILAPHVVREADKYFSKI